MYLDINKCCFDVLIVGLESMQGLRLLMIMQA